MPQALFTLRPVLEEVVGKLSSGLDVTPTMARILAARGFTDVATAELFLQAPADSLHDPFLLRDMDRAVPRIIRAITGQEKICIYGDYDVDGAVSTALLMRFLRSVGAVVTFYIPNRVREGYSLNETALKKIAGDGCRLVITVDNGIMANAGVGIANDLGMHVIVTDHHQVGTELPAALAVIDPQRADCPYPFKGICGAGVVFKLMMALRQTLRLQGHFAARPEPNLKNDLDMLCIATVCDCMPLVGENRFMVREGLKQLQRTRRPGLSALLAVSGLGESVTSSDLGFRLGPRLNACGRLEDASLGVRLLLTDDASEAQTLAQQLDSLNQERQVIEKDMVASALASAADDLSMRSGIVLYAPTWHIGVLGIVASRIAERFGRPTFILGRTEDGVVKGSGRAVGAVNLVEALRRCEAHLKAYGGHEAAAGVSLIEDQVENFRMSFDNACCELMAVQKRSVLPEVDALLQLSDISEQLCEELKRLEPCGMGNRRPIFATLQPVPVLAKRIVGEDHLKLVLGRGAERIEAIAFRQALAAEQLKEHLSAVFYIEKNRFRERETIQLVIQKIAH